MKISDIRNQDTKKLNDTLATKKSELAEAIREKRVSERGDLHAIRNTRKDIARILTVINQSEPEEETK